MCTLFSCRSRWSTEAKGELLGSFLRSKASGLGGVFRRVRLTGRQNNDRLRRSRRCLRRRCRPLDARTEHSAGRQIALVSVRRLGQGGTARVGSLALCSDLVFVLATRGQGVKPTVALDQIEKLAEQRNMKKRRLRPDDDQLLLCSGEAYVQSAPIQQKIADLCSRQKRPSR